MNGQEDETHYTVARDVEDILRNFLYGNYRKANYIKRTLNMKSFGDGSDGGKTKFYEPLPDEIQEAIVETAEMIDGAVEAARRALIGLVKSGLLTEYEVGEAMKTLQSTDLSAK